jgi:hypothetical protein
MPWNVKAMRAAEQARDERARSWLGSLFTNNIGWNYFDAGNFEKAKVTFQKCLEFMLAHASLKRQQIAKWSLARVGKGFGPCKIRP